MEKKKQKQAEEKNNELKEKIEDIKNNLEDKTEDIKKNLTKKAKDLSENIKEKTGDIKSDLEDKTKDITDDLKNKAKNLKEDIQEKAEELKDKTEEILKDIKDSTKKFEKKDIQENKAMACLSYIIPPVPYFIENKSKWVRYHAIQGMNLFITFIILTLFISVINKLLLYHFVYIQTILRTTLNVFTAIYSIVGIINVCNGEAKELPIINKLKFIKK